MTGADPKPVTIAVDARPFAGPPCGYTVYLTSIIECLRSDEFRLVLLSNRPLLSRFPQVSGLETHVFGYPGDLKWEQADLPRFLRDRSYAIYFSGANRGIPLKKNGRTRYILGLLDVIPYLFWRDYLWAPLVRADRRARTVKETLSQLVSVARADAVLTISHQSAADIRRVFRRAATACPIRLADRAVTPPDEVKPQFVYVGGVDARKRVGTLVEAFARFTATRPDFRLVLIGSNYAAVEGLIERLNLSDRVVRTGYVDDDAKFRIMAESTAMVYPSMYEGYGLAVAEGFQAHIPVIAGRGGSQAEVGGDAVRYVDPTSPKDIAAAMGEMLDPAVRDEWIGQGRRQLERLVDPSVEQGIQEYFREQARAAPRR